MKKIIILLVCLIVSGCAEDVKSTDTYKDIDQKLKNWAGQERATTTVDYYQSCLIEKLNERVSLLEKKGKPS